ncbi:asparagine synthase (glutamine-hydrolyzing) [Bordetella hinzii]|uniref:asparagine synthase (glutamine-hydrolyzing) n=1 Tax=Bordetella hinzii TaxID=103855 RepID=UPI000459DFA6|nr:asparagine synthase (glutamine-hydrolyzing) [Bordetella hinzii]KCB46167.1 asparagine synthase (glutamine-hydrolyzing) [Bordetella hinzii 4161]KXA73690.1 asparagine synthetase B [Bordetella hinzii LMG 13501]QDJ32119.1 asparagine synthetase B [Bordetella hinzii]QDJ36695.1 asparagine synthetase B [Bordetella hinzii]VEH27396.1 glutamine amidotransferase [Bordetella hinzii]
MCGILGGWWRDGAFPETRLTSALRSLAHRGPDDHGQALFAAGAGNLALGHNRLSIIDLTSAGHQPMRRAGLHIVFNGEIYNYRELRQTLAAAGQVFDTDTDTEVLLAAWLQWGERCLTRFVGMFAFALYDERTTQLVLARDAFGIKPLYYSLDAQRLVFASELPAVRVLDPLLNKLDWQQAYDYLSLGRYDHGQRSFIDGIVQLAPGSLLRHDLSTGKILAQERWWRPEVSRRFEGSFEQAAEQFRAGFLDSVRLHLRSDVPVGAALSGGLDSSAIVCAMRHLEPGLPIHTFSYIAPPPNSEARWVELVNGHCGAVGHSLTLDAPELAADLDELVRCQGEPFGSTSIYSQYRIFKLAREHGIVVTLEGQGADELLAGYEGYPMQRLASLLGAGHFAEAMRHGAAQARLGRNARNMWAQAIALTLSPKALAALRQAFAPTPDWLDRQVLREAGVAAAAPLESLRIPRGRQLMGAMARALQDDGLGALLRHGDRNSMRFSLESRVPFLTLPLANFLLGLPEDFHLAANGQTKRLMRHALRGLVPDAILDRPDKIGFATPEKAWLTALRPQLRSWLQAGPDIPFLHRPRVLERFDAMMQGQLPFSWQAWRWVNFQRWLTLCAVQP